MFECSLTMAKSVKRKTFLLHYLLYTGVVAIAILLYSLTDRFALQRISEFSVWSFALNTVVVLALGALILLLRYMFDGLLQKTLYRRQIALQRLIPEIRDLLLESNTLEDFSNIVHDALRTLMNVDDTQLSLFYDQPFALEVTHLRRTPEGGNIVIVERVRQDEAGVPENQESLLSPLTALATAVLTHRDRMVGMLLLGGDHERVLNSVDHEIMEELTRTIAFAGDQLMMLRNLSETKQRLFENEKLIGIGQLASGIAHEIRNPLTSIKLNLQGLKKTEALSERNERRIQISLDEIDRLDSIISELMSFARRTKLNVRETSADILIGASLDLVQSVLQQKNIEVKREIPANLPTVRVDENKIIRILINLLKNSAEAMEEAGSLVVRAVRYGAGLEIQIADKGPGIPRDIQREIFNPFFTTKAEGTGLGLANALKFAQEHGGELDFHSEEGNGATFSLRLPPAPPAHLEDPAALKVLPT